MIDRYALPRRARGTVAAGLIALATLLFLAACTTQKRQDISEAFGRYPVSSSATFPTSQTLSQHTHMVVTVQNVGHHTIPNIAVTICNISCRFPAPPGEGTSAQAFSENLNQPYLAQPSRPVWIVDHPPGGCAYSCYSGGQGTAVTAYSNTWALGPLSPGHTVTFDWAVTAVMPGTHTVAWEVAAGLNGHADAVGPNGKGLPSGTITVKVDKKPSTALAHCSSQVAGHTRHCTPLPNQT